MDTNRHNSIENVLRRLSLAGLLLASVANQSNAETLSYDLPYAFGADWAFTLTLEGPGVKEVATSLDFSGESMSDRLIVMAGERVKCKMSARYVGTQPLVIGSENLEILSPDPFHFHWTVNGKVAEGVADLYTDPTTNAITVPLNWTITYKRADLLGTPNYQSSYEWGWGYVYIRKPLRLNVKVADRTISVSAHKPHPKFAPDGGVTEDEVADPIPGVEVKVVNVGDSSFEMPDSEWKTTSDQSTLMVPVSAPLDSQVDQTARAIVGAIGVVAVHERVRLAEITDLEIPFAEVLSSNGGWLLESFGGYPPRDAPKELLAPLNPLVPGDWIEAKSPGMGSSGVIQLRFCDGSQAVLADYGGGTRACIGEDSTLVLGTRSSVAVYFQENLDQIRSNPREMAGIVVTKAIFDGAGNLIPGGSIVERLVDEAGNVLQEYVTNTILRIPLDRRRSTDGAFPPDAGFVDYGMRIMADGTFRLENRGASLSIQSDRGSREILPSCQVLVDPHRTGNPISSPALLPAPYPPDPGCVAVLRLAPENGSTVTTLTPRLGGYFEETTGDPVKPETFQAWVDRRYASAGFMTVSNGAAWSVPASAPLAPGQHLLEAEVTTVAGRRIVSTSTFTVAALPGSPEGLQAVSAPSRVALRWLAGLGASTHEVARAVTASGPWTVLSPTGGTPRGWFVDESPLASAVYRVTPLNATGSAGSPVFTATVAWPGTAPAAPDAVTGVNLVVENQGVRVNFSEASWNFCLWKIERGTSATGPFVEVAPGGMVSSPGWVDGSCPKGVAVWYRITPVNAAGATGTAVVASSVTRPAELDAPTGLFVRVDGTGSHLRWDPYPNTVSAWKLYRRTMTNTWALVRTCAASATSADEPAPASDNATAWRIAAVLPGLGETPPSERACAAIHTVAGPVGSIGVQNATVHAAEGTNATVTFTRTGGTADAVFLRYYTTTVFSGSTATEGSDYEPRGGTLVFEPGETTKSVSIPVNHDTATESTPETFEVRISGINGAITASESPGAVVTIHDPDIISWRADAGGMITEANTQMILHVSRAWPSNRTVAIDCESDLVNSTATAGSDYLAVAKHTLVFQPGETDKTVAVTVLDDSTKEPWPEAVFLKLSNPAGGAVLSGDASRYFRITDDDTHTGQVRWAVSELSGLENSGGVGARLERVGGTDGSLIVWISERGGKADSWIDWMPNFVPGGQPGMPVFFEDGQTFADITIPFMDDNLVEGAEHFVLGASSSDATGAVSPESMLSVTILDDEVVASAFNGWAATLPAGKRGLMDDPDRDGQSNLAEFALMSNGNLPSPGLPGLIRTPWDTWGLDVTVRDDPGITVVAEFSTTPDFANSFVDGGFWDPPVDGHRHVLFASRLDPANLAAFARLVIRRQGN